MSKTTKSSSNLAPEDIRRIRENLGLSQVEAGELLGGGPRAFTKYESGKIKPAASVVNILRLLEADPGALSKLTGRKAPPLPNDDAKPFEVTGQHVAQLTPRNLAILARRLLAAEAQSSGLPMDGLHVAAEITASDGGEDARIKWTGGPDRTPFLPNRLNQFQLKATRITPKDAAADVLMPTGAIKPMIREVLAAGGTYIMLCTSSFTKKEIEKRETSIRQALSKAGLSLPDDRIQFRDADQLAQWINTHPPVAAWILEQTQPGLAGPFRAWSHWAGRFEHESSPWVEDSRLAQFRARLRQLVSPPRGVARIIGLSGIGKSRLALEALARPDDLDPSQPDLNDLILYAVESETETAIVKTVVQNLADAGKRAIVVVDRCTAETHQDLAAIVKRSSSRLSLVTIDHEIPRFADLPDDTIKVDAAADAVIAGMLKQIDPDMPQLDRERLVKFAGGSPQIAVLLARSWLKEQPLASASDDVLIDRIILGRKPRDAQLLHDAAQILSVFALVGFKSPLDQDLADIAKLAPHNRTADDLRGAFNDLQSRGVVQQRGRLVTLQPRSISFALAERQWRAWSPEVWERILTGSDVPEHLRESAARQLALLNTTATAKNVTKHLCRLNGPLANLQELCKPGNTKVLSALAEIDADATADLLDHVLKPCSTKELENIRGDARRQLVWALEKIAFTTSAFEQGAGLLLALAEAENETWGNNATGQFQALFPAFLGNTAADPDARLRVLDEHIKSDGRRLRIVVDALVTVLDIGSATRTIGAEIHGSRPALQPWQPRTWQDVWDYVQPCLERLTEIAMRADSIGDWARDRLGERLRTLVSAGRIDLVEQATTKIAAARGKYWPEAHSSLGHVLVYDGNGLKAGDKKRIRALMKMLTPDTVADRVRLLVTEMPWDYPDGEQLEFEEREKRQKEDVGKLATDLLKTPDTLKTFLPQLSRGEQRMSFFFGRSLAERASDPLAWREPIMTAFESAPADDRNFGMLAGYFAGLAQRNLPAVQAFKESAAQSPVFAPTLPAVAASIGIEERDVDLVLKALDEKLLPPHFLRQWCMGRALEKLPPATVAPLFDKLLRLPEGGYEIALDLIGMYVHNSKETLDALRPQLLGVAQNVRHLPDGPRSHMAEFHFTEIIKWLLNKGRDDQDARAAAATLTQYLVEGGEFHVERLIKPLLPKLLSEFPELVWPPIGQAIVADPKSAWRFEHVLGDSFSFQAAKQPPLLNLAEDVLFAWCRSNPDVGPAFVAATVPILTGRDPNAPGHGFHPLTQRLLDEFGSRDDVLRAITRNMYTFGWTGSRANYFALYQEPLRSLAEHPLGAVRLWAKKMVTQMSHEIEAAQNDDDEQQARWGS